MSKRFSGKPCAYCSTALSDTGDHVFARQFFPVAQRGNLPKVPACRRCNGEKAKLETYLATIMLFGGRHRDARQNLIADGQRRLAKNLALHRKLFAGKQRIWLPDQSGLVVPTMALPWDDQAFTKYFEYVVRGLMCFEFGEVLGPSDYVEVHTVTAVAGAPIYRNLLKLNSAAKANRDLGNGAFVYEGSKGLDNGHVSVWLINAFGGLTFQDEDGRGYETRVGAMTGPRRVADKVEIRQKWIEGRAAF